MVVDKDKIMTELKEMCIEELIQDSFDFNMSFQHKELLLSRFADKDRAIQQLGEKVKEMDKENRKLFLDAVNANFALALQITDLQEKVRVLSEENKGLKSCLKMFHLDMEGWEWNENLGVSHKTVKGEIV
jgi:hypothetical protein